MKTPLHTLLLLAAIGTSLTSQLAHADFLDSIKSAASKEFSGSKESSSTDSSSLGSLGSLVSGGDLSSLTPANASNAAGILQFCVKNNVLSGNGVANVKNQLFSKLGIQTEEQTKNEDFQDGLKGILHGEGTGNLDLSNLSAGTSKLKEKITEKACDIVLDKAKSFL